MGKKKNKNKVSGAVKTAAKTEKKLANKLKKELANLGEEDISKVIAEIEREEAKRAAASEKVLKAPPSARAYATLTPHPNNNELILFGGEYHDGQKTQTYNDLYIYNPASNAWRQLKAPGAPPPRSAHQAVSTPANKGELWVFGGEFTSPSETQFYHYKDLWCFSFADKKWEKVISPNGPSPRSGHRMVLLNRKLYVFGGYCDDGRDCRYFDDLYTFCLDSRTWSKVGTSGRGPSARSACVMLPSGQDSLIIYGGFSRIRDGKSERACTHGDMYRLTIKMGASGPDGASGPSGGQWRSVSTGGAPPPRAGVAAAVNVTHDRAYVFGGVNDVEETDEELRGEMSDDLLLLELDSAKWHHVTLNTQRQKKREDEKEEMEDVVEEEAVTVVTDEVFTMKLGAPSGPPPAPSPGLPTPRAGFGGPAARMSAMMVVHRSTLYVYGGVLEKDEKQFYLGDMYSLDLHKLNEWKTIIQQPALPDWLGSDSDWESDGSDSGSDSDESDD